jgi:hypothetical protein
MVTQKLTAHDLRRASILAKCDPRTIRRRLEGRQIRSLALREAIDDALRQLGFASPALPADDPDVSRASTEQ